MRQKSVYILYCMCLFVISFAVQAQHNKVLPPQNLAQKNAAKKSEVLNATYKGIVRIKPNAPDWHIKLTSHSISHPETEDEQNNEQWNERQTQKERRKYTQLFEKQKIGTNFIPSASDKQTAKTESSNLFVGASFEGNTTSNWYPPDNHLAISNAGIIVSVINSQVSYFSSSGALLNAVTFDNLFSDF